MASFTLAMVALISNPSYVFRTFFGHLLSLNGVTMYERSIFFRIQ